MPTVQIPYDPRPQQKEVARALRRGVRFLVLVCHRRMGKTVAGVNILQQGALRCEKLRPRFMLLGPTYRQAKATAWDYLQYYARPIPGVAAHQGELRVDYPNGGQVRLFGSDNFDAMRGLYSDGVWADEFGLHPSESFSTVIAPMLVDRGGWVVLSGTPNGQNQFYDMAMRAQEEEAQGNPEWAYLEFKASQTGLLDQAYLDAARKVMTEDEYLQEFECSWAASVRGSIYGREMQTALDEGRITSVAYDAALPVDTTWDLGVGDATAIWFTQATRSGEVRFIDYHEASGEGLPYYARILQQKPYVYRKHYGPHDLAVRDLGTGKSRIETAAALGIRFELVPNIGLEDGIAALRLLLPRCWFDATRCKAGLEALRAYRRDWNQRLGEFKATPVHDWSSHASDAARYVAVWMTPPAAANAPLRRTPFAPAGPTGVGWMG